MHAAALEILKPNLKYVFFIMVTPSDLVTGLAHPFSMSAADQATSLHVSPA